MLQLSLRRCRLLVLVPLRISGLYLMFCADVDVGIDGVGFGVGEDFVVWGVVWMRVVSVCIRVWVSLMVLCSIHNMCTWMIDRFGTPELRAHYVPGLCTMDVRILWEQKFFV